ncbi:MAG: nuclear transport factor 2 family protein [Bradyrhizobium sp.]|nr:nuclear transport factor 2 family protein [Bradyrhizobium sp.]
MLLSRNLGSLSIVAALVFGLHNAAAAAESDGVELSNLASCYADGIDMIGNGKTEAGANRWRQCFAEDLKFTLTFGTSFTMTCPGEKCPMPASMSGVDRRVAAARNTYDRAGYMATSHHLTSIGIEQSAPDRARVNAHLQAWHVRKDGATVLGLGSWAVDARKTASGWRIVEETLESPLRVVIPKSE